METMKRRGRPRIFSAEFEEMVYRHPSFGDQHQSRRSLQNHHYEQRAFRVLGFAGDDGEQESAHATYRWLSNPDRQVGGKRDPRAYRKVVLAELGRFQDDDLLRQAARVLCQLEPTTSREAIALLRRWRLGDQPSRREQLAKRIEAILRDHLCRYPEATLADLQQSWGEAYAAVLNNA